MARDSEGPPNEREKILLFRDSMIYEVAHTFGIPSELQDEQLADHTIGELVNYSRHVHARLWWDFFHRGPQSRGKPEQRKKNDDAFCSDFDYYPSDYQPLTCNSAETPSNEDLNKGLLHLTYGRVRNKTNKPWSNPIIQHLLPLTIAFMQHIRDNPILPGGSELFTGTDERELWLQLLNCLMQCQDGCRLRFSSGFGDQRKDFGIRHSTVGTPSVWYKFFTEPGDVAKLYGDETRAPLDGALWTSSMTNTTQSGFIVSRSGKLMESREHRR
ncbi:hypothetical protein AB1L88_19890 [Tautonia sp. JC769]|uniref:hypothetical protein n=1 Tax=Tautonia sp. JC769 TaxID=3232135 RepID=UPI00345855B4